MVKISEQARKCIPDHGQVGTVNDVDSNAAMMVFFSGPDVIATQIVQCGSAIKFVDSS